MPRDPLTRSPSPEQYPADGRAPVRGHPDVEALRPDDFNLGRIQLKEPGPIPEHEARWAWEWMASWGLMSGTFEPTMQINRSLEQETHKLAAASLVG